MPGRQNFVFTKSIFAHAKLTVLAFGDPFGVPQVIADRRAFGDERQERFLGVALELARELRVARPRPRLSASGSTVCTRTIRCRKRRREYCRSSAGEGASHPRSSQRARGCGRTPSTFLFLLRSDKCGSCCQKRPPRISRVSHRLTRRAFIGDPTDPIVIADNVGNGMFLSHVHTLTTCVVAAGSYRTCCVRPDMRTMSRRSSSVTPEKANVHGSGLAPHLCVPPRFMVNLAWASSIRDSC